MSDRFSLSSLNGEPSVKRALPKTASFPRCGVVSVGQVSSACPRLFLARGTRKPYSLLPSALDIDILHLPSCYTHHTWGGTCPSGRVGSEL
jgi:hypothetical protein